MQIRGIIPPVATPMQSNEDLDLPRLKWFLDHLIREGVHGIFVLGTNSEFYGLDDREKQEEMDQPAQHGPDCIATGRRARHAGGRSG